MSCRNSVLQAVLLVFVLSSQAAWALRSTSAKKLIEYGWDVPTPGFVREHIKEMEQRPFDGVTMRLPELSEPFKVAQWDERRFAGVMDDLRSIKWGSFTDNFILVLSASDMDWFSDRDWATVQHNLGLIASAAAAGGCKGICFDPEPYGNSPWSYAAAAHRGARSFAEYEAQARKRGAEFMRAITDRMPDAVIHTFFLLSLFSDLAPEPDLLKREKALSEHQYALLPAFLNGMLDGAGAHTIITDGNESAYYYTEPLAYYQAYHWMRQGAKTLVASDNAPTYDTHVQVSQALYIDYVFGLGGWRKKLSSTLSREERARWFQQDVYYALSTADQYVWCYSEEMSWWENRGVPPGLGEAIELARRKIALGQALGYDMGPALTSAFAKLRSELQSRILHRTAAIARRPSRVAPPVIDGKLDDPVWQRIGPLDAFLPYVTSDDETVKAGAEVRATYDDDSLYLGIRCEEPAPGEMRPLGATKNDDSIWSGDTIDISLSVGQSPVPYLHFILSPSNMQWNARSGDSEDRTFNPHWQSSTSILEHAWQVEIAFPWKELGISVPRPGESHRANVCRQRIPGDEHSCWSQTYEGFLDPENMGTWVFGN